MTSVIHPMGTSDLYGPADDAESIAAIHAALDAGLTLLDSGDFYAGGHSELRLAWALEGGNRHEVAISVRGSRHVVATP